MKPLEAELALSYCERARASISRVAELVNQPTQTQAIERALDAVLELQRQVDRDTRRG